MLPITAESLQDTAFEQDQLVEVLQYSLWRSRVDTAVAERDYF